MHQLTSSVIVVNGNEKNNRKLFISLHEIGMKYRRCFENEIVILYLPLYYCPKTTRTAVYRAVQCVQIVLSYFTMCVVYSSLLGFIELYACRLRAVCLPSVTAYLITRMNLLSKA